MISLLWFLVGLAALVGGAELVVQRGSRLATRLGISPIVIGLTLVSIGTSAPELAIGIAAAWRDNGSLAVGNIAGTNTANILLILGTTALIRPLALDLRTLRLDLPVTAVASLTLVIMAWNGMLTRLDGLMLIAAAILYSAVIVHLARRESRAAKAEYARGFGAPPEGLPYRKVVFDLGAVVIGIGVIVIGSDWLVDGAVGLARTLGVSDAFIGLTVVAVGTSVPELVTAVVATLRNQRDIAVGNILGSCVYNIFLILGVTCLIPAAGIRVTTELAHIDIPVMTVVAVVCIPVALSGHRIRRAEGALFLAAYIGYLAYLVLTRT
jgi:cation:H+ antiporter